MLHLYVRVSEPACITADQIAIVQELIAAGADINAINSEVFQLCLCIHCMQEQIEQALSVCLPLPAMLLVLLRPNNQVIST